MPPKSLMPFAWTSPVATLCREVVPSKRSRRKTSQKPLVSAATRFVASEANSTKRPFALILGKKLPVVALDLAAADAHHPGEARLHLVNKSRYPPPSVPGDEVAGVGLEGDVPAVATDRRVPGAVVAQRPSVVDAHPPRRPGRPVAQEDVGRRVGVGAPEVGRVRLKGHITAVGADGGSTCSRCSPGPRSQLCSPGRSSRPPGRGRRRPTDRSYPRSPGWSPKSQRPRSGRRR